MHKQLSKPVNVMLTLSFFGIGGLYLWFVTTAVFA